jgi:autotransporter translocation and assembly factor TamB
MPFTDVVLYFTHHSADTTGYNTSVSIASVGRTAYGLLSAELLINVDSLLTAPSPGAYRFIAGFDEVRTSIGDFAAVNLTGSIFAAGIDPLLTRPEITGKIAINEALVGRPTGGSSSGSSASLPFDLNIAVRSNRGVWFRSSLADIELGVDITILTVNTYPTLGGTISSLRGKVRLLDRDFDIDAGTIEFISSVPPGTRMSITAKTIVRDVIDNSDYTIWVSIQGTPTNPLITLSGEGPSGTLAQEDILALLAVGLTYGELQQIDSANIRDQLEDAAQGYLGRLLARSLREGIGLDELQLTPELLADSTSLTLNVGKYVLPDLFVSYTGDVFSTEPGTISAQYYFSRDLYVTGSTKSTLHGSQEPSLELHYTFRY